MGANQAVVERPVLVDVDVCYASIQAKAHDITPLNRYIDVLGQLEQKLANRPIMMTMSTSRTVTLTHPVVESGRLADGYRSAVQAEFDNGANSRSSLQKVGQLVHKLLVGEQIAQRPFIVAVSFCDFEDLDAQLELLGDGMIINVGQRQLAHPRVVQYSPNLPVSFQ